MGPSAAAAVAQGVLLQALAPRLAGDGLVGLLPALCLCSACPLPTGAAAPSLPLQTTACTIVPNTPLFCLPFRHAVAANAACLLSLAAHTPAACTPRRGGPRGRRR